jgi:hypothetical protein
MSHALNKFASKHPSVAKLAKLQCSGTSSNGGSGGGIASTLTRGTVLSNMMTWGSKGRRLGPLLPSQPPDDTDVPASCRPGSSASGLERRQDAVDTMPTRQLPCGAARGGVGGVPRLNLRRGLLAKSSWALQPQRHEGNSGTAEGEVPVDVEESGRIVVHGAEGTRSVRLSFGCGLGYMAALGPRRRAAKKKATAPAKTARRRTLQLLELTRGETPRRTRESDKPTNGSLMASAI